MVTNEHGLCYWNMDTGREALAAGGGLQSSLVVARRPVRRPWRQLTLVSGCGSWFVVAPTVLGCCWSVMEAFGRISCFSRPPSRCSHLEIWTLPLPSFLSALVRYLGVACGVRRIFGTRAQLGSTVDTLSTRVLTNFSRCFWLQFSQCGSHVGILDIISPSLPFLGSLRRFLLLSAAGALDDEEFFIIEGSV